MSMLMMLACPCCGKETRIDNGMCRLYASDGWHADCTQCGEDLRLSFYARAASAPVTEKGITA